MKPLARNNDIVVQEVFDELVIYDLERDRVHSLNPTAAFVWRHCDGQHTLDKLAALLQQEFQISQAEALLWPTLERLEKAHLLQGKVTQPGGSQNTYTRREMLKMAGRGAGLTVAMLPVIVSLAAPPASQAGISDCDGLVVEKNNDIHHRDRCNQACRDAGYAGGGYRILISGKDMTCCCGN